MLHDQPVSPPRRSPGVSLLLAAAVIAPPLALLAALLAPAARGPLLWATLGLYLAGAALLARLRGADLRAADQARAADAAARAALARRARELEHTLELQQADLAARAGAEAALSRQLAYSQALARCSQTLLRQDAAAADLRATLEEALDLLRCALELDRLYVYQHVGPTDTCIAHTIAGSRSPEGGEVHFAASMPIRLMPPAVHAALIRGESVGGPVEVAFADAPDFQQHLRESGTRSIQIVPIHQDGQWWGCLLASDTHEPRLWDAPACRLLHTAAEMIAAFLQSWHAGRQLHRSRQQLQQAMWAGDLAFWEWDGLTDTTTISSEMSALLGYDPAAIDDPLAFWMARVHPDDRTAIGQMIRLNQSGQTAVFDTEYRMLHQDGTWHWLRSCGRVVEQAADGRPLRAIGVSQEITHQKQAEQEIQSQRDFAQQVITLMGQGLAVLDAAGHIAYANPRLSQILGYQLDELVGRNPEEITPEQLHGKLAAEHEQRARGEVSTYELQLRHKDGGLRDLLITAAPIMREGAAQGTISVLTDMSDYKRIEEDLRQAKEAAEAADHAKSRFLAHMSHEIRTPLNAVIGMSSLLQETPLSPDQRELLATIRTGSETLLEIINTILDFSKIESGQMSLAARPFDLPLCVEEAAHLVALQAAQKQLDMQVQIDPEVPNLVIGDELRVRQVLVNLLANAVKFTERGGVRLRVTRDVGRGPQEAAQAEAAAILFEVHDTGIGISLDQLDRIFDPFTQAPAGSGHVGGTGLGLAICRQLVDAMGGTLHVASAAGQGSTFTARVPLRPAPEGAVAQSHRPALVDRLVLLVAHPGPERERLAAMCRGWGMLPTLIDSGPAALAQLDAGLPYDIAVVALGPPDQISLLTARAISEHRAWARRPLIVVTDRAQPQDAAAPQRCGGMLSRPVRRARFADALAEALAAASAGARVDAGALRVLLAEDNLVNQQVTVRLLQQLQIQADLAINGREAVAALRRQPYDLVLMDAQMPELDGIQATQAIRALGDAIAQPYIVALTALAMAGDRERFLAAGMNDYLSKPVQMDDLRAALARLRGWGDRPARPDPEPGAAHEPPADAPIDWSVLEQLQQALGADGDATILQLVGLFRSEIVNQIDQLAAVIQAGDLAQVIHIAHRLYGSCRQMGATLMANLAFTIERTAQGEERAALPTLAEALRAAYDQALDLLTQRYVAEGRP